MHVLMLLLGVVITITLLAAFAAVVQRLLNMQFGLLRMVVVAILAQLLTGATFSALVVPDAAEHGWGGGGGAFWGILTWAIVSVVAGMILLVVAEAIAPTGSLPTLRVLRRELRGRIRRTRRYLKIIRIAAQHGLGPYLRGRRPPEHDLPSRRRLRARSLRLMLDDGGVTFVKLGQLLSTRSDLLAAELIEELSLLRDRVAAAPWEEIEPVLVAELGLPVEEIFAKFDRTPLAAASLAQVYAARLLTGEEVVVKVQRPTVQHVVESDLDIVYRLAARLARKAAWARSIGVRDLASGFARAVREELDFTIEAANLTAVAASQTATDNTCDTADASDTETTAVVIPRPHLKLCSTRVLVMDRIDGGALGAAQVAAATPGLEPAKLSRTLLASLLHQTMVGGVFHADPHPGNVLLLTDGRIGLIDFGSVGRLDRTLREALQRFLLAVDQADSVAATDALLEITHEPEDIDERGLERELGHFIARHLGPGATPRAAMMSELFRIVAARGLTIPPDVAAVFRALATLEGTIAQLDPDFDVMAEAREFARRHIGVRFKPAALRRTVTEELAMLMPMLRRLPRRVERITQAAERGRLGANVRLFADRRDRLHITGMLHQVLLTVLGATSGVMGAMLLGTPDGPALTTELSLYQVFGYSLLVVAVVLVLRVLAHIFRREP